MECEARIVSTFNSLLAEQPGSTLCGYTDGSKSSNNITTCAAVFPAIDVIEAWTLRKDSSVFPAELQAINQALRFVYNMENSLHAVTIFIDSSPAIKAITSVDPAKNEAITDIRELIGSLKSSGTRTTLAWIPSHVGIEDESSLGELPEPGSVRGVPWFSLVVFRRFSDFGNLRLFSISMDGCLCLWLFVQGELYPTELTTLPFQGDNRLQENNLGAMALTASCSCMAIHPNHTMVLVGTDQGQLWPVSNEGEVLNWGPVNAHQCPIYTVQWNPFHHQVFITCGTDWLVKIWDQRENSTAFACMSSNGKVLIYDLNICLHKPLCSQRITPQRRAQPTILSFAPFHPVILVGDDKGHVTCLKLSPNLRKVSRVPESSRIIEVEMEKLERVITLMKR
ncbi:hypothetical protein OUZ56_003462 [Daphnia magna]|uniref:RNase H type-1 domain-containing protein n=1 Tax=Daphnia magna TaxID=35525 RepID=A0ABR0A935_9CRUS|nr:hypothetical protein OUZ56_003462 [Daphnia magna]